MSKQDGVIFFTAPPFLRPRTEENLDHLHDPWMGNEGNFPKASSLQGSVWLGMESLGRERKLKFFPQDKIEERAKNQEGIRIKGHVEKTR
jgi:hypothetical protein